MKEQYSTERLNNFNFEQAVIAGINESLTKIKLRFEENPEYKNNLAYHNRLHSQRVIRRTGLILHTIQSVNPRLITERDLKTGLLIASFHDVVQDFEEEKIICGEFTAIRRKRHATFNERASAREAIKFMECMNVISKNIIFRKADKKLAEESIDATIPGFDPNLKTVIQPYLTSDSSIISRAVALADIGTAGLDGAKLYINDGNELFREENLDILEKINSGEPISWELNKFYRDRILSWTMSQQSFAVGRKLRLDKEIEGIPGIAKDKVFNLFNRFHESIDASVLILSTRAKMTLDELIIDLGYKK